MKWVLLGGLLAVLALYPALASALLAVLGAAAVTMAAKPVVLSFTAGLIVGPRLARKLAR